MNNNYIGKVDAEWVDPVVELPPDGCRVVCLVNAGARPYTFRCERGDWIDDDGLLRVPAAWLRIGGPSTAIPHEKAQEAVDRIDRLAHMGLTGTIAAEDPERVAASEAYANCIGVMEKITGITPSVVKESLTTEVTFQTLLRIARRVDEKYGETWNDPALCTDADVWAEVQKIIKEEINEVTP